MSNNTLQLHTIPCTWDVNIDSNSVSKLTSTLNDDQRRAANGILERLNRNLTSKNSQLY